MPDYNSSRIEPEVKFGDFTYVMGGHTQKFTIWVQEGPTTPINIGHDPIAFSLFYKTPIAGSGISIVDNVVSVVGPIGVSSGGTGVTSFSQSNAFVLTNGSSTGLVTLTPVNNTILTFDGFGAPTLVSTLVVARGGTG